VEPPHANAPEERFSCRNPSFGARVASIFYVGGRQNTGISFELGSKKLLVITV
jgi:hypothetical protein